MSAFNAVVRIGGEYMGGLRMMMRVRSSSMRSSAAKLSLLSNSVRFVSSSICSCVRPYSSLHFWCSSFFLLSLRSSSDESGCGAAACAHVRHPRGREAARAH